MKNIFLIFMTIILSVPVFSQDSIQPPPKPKPVEVKWSGFIMDNLFYDTRKNADALDGMVLLFPLPEAKDSLGDDLNKIPNLSLLSFASRLKCNMSGPDAFGAVTSGYIELDFTARAEYNKSSTASLRFRQAWAKLNWKSTELLVGRTWHPLGSMDVVPSVMGLSIGAPFQPFNRSEQITLTQKVGKINFIFSALFQNDYINNGPNGRLPANQTNAVIPNLHFQTKYKSEMAIFGWGIDYKRLKPRIFTTSTAITPQKFSTDATVDCIALLAYGQIKFGKLTISSKTILANNTSESLMTGAFGVSDYDAVTGHEEYTPYTHWFIWGNISYGNKLKSNLFGGYLKNLGAGENIVAPNPTSGLTTSVFGLGESIGSMYRLVYTESYTSGKVTFALEVEYNNALYGTIDYTDKGRIVNAKAASSTRVLATMYYFF
jgi:hypothetical protein